MITTVLIDVDNTLLDFDKCAEEAMERTFEMWGMEFSNEIFPVFRRVNDMLWQKIEKGELEKPGLYKVRWKTIFEILGINRNGPEFENDFRLVFSECKQTVEGAYGLLEYFSKKYTVCAASNASAWQQNKRLKNADMMKYISHIFISEELGAPKPEKKFFDACLERLGNIPKEQVVLIGDSLSADINGGADYGLETKWFNYDKLPVDKGVRADWVVHSLNEIKSIL